MSELIAHTDVAVLTVAEARVIDEIRAVLNLDDYVLAVIDETRLVIDPQRLGELSSRLAAAGLTPLMKRAPGPGERRRLDESIGDDETWVD